MSVILSTKTGKILTGLQDRNRNANLYELGSCVLRNYGELAIGIKGGTTNTLTINTGMFVTSGVLCENDSIVEIIGGIEISPTNKKLIVTVNAGTGTVVFSTVTAATALTQQNLVDVPNGIYQMELATFTVTNGNITNLTTTFNFQSQPVDVAAELSNKVSKTGDTMTGSLIQKAQGVFQTVASTGQQFFEKIANATNVQMYLNGFDFDKLMPILYSQKYGYAKKIRTIPYYANATGTAQGQTFSNNQNCLYNLSDANYLIVTIGGFNDFGELMLRKSLDGIFRDGVIFNNGPADVISLQCVIHESGIVNNLEFMLHLPSGSHGAKQYTVKVIKVVIGFD